MSTVDRMYIDMERARQRALAAERERVREWNEAREREWMEAAGPFVPSEDLLEAEARAAVSGNGNAAMLAHRIRFYEEGAWRDAGEARLSRMREAKEKK